MPKPTIPAAPLVALLVGVGKGVGLVAAGLGYADRTRRT